MSAVAPNNPHTTDNLVNFQTNSMQVKLIRRQIMYCAQHVVKSVSKYQSSNSMMAEILLLWPHENEWIPNEED